jgi:hypothetical protein
MSLFFTRLAAYMPALQDNVVQCHLFPSQQRPHCAAIDHFADHVMQHLFFLVKE